MLPGSICRENIPAPFSWQEVSLSFSVETCAPLCKSPTASLGRSPGRGRPPGILCPSLPGESLRGQVSGSGHRLLKPPNESLVFVGECRGKTRAKLSEEMPRISEIDFPIIGFHAEKCAQRLGRNFQAIKRKRATRRHITDRCFFGFTPSFDAFENPFEHPHILPKARPQVLAVGAFAEPVHVKDLRRVGDALAHVQPVL